MSALGPVSGAALVAALLVPMSPAGAAPVPTCQGEPATVVGTPHADRLVGTPEADVIVGLNGDDVVRGRGGDDLVCGGDGADMLLGGAGADRLYGQREARISDRGGTYFIADRPDGGPGDDLLDVGGDRRWVNWGSHGDLDFGNAASGVTVDLAAGTASGQGTDTVVAYSGTGCDFSCYGVGLLGSAHDDVLSGTDASDLLVGNAGDDHLVGLGGADEMHGEAQYGGGTPGDDSLDGGPGTDALYAYAGSDVLEGGAGRDIVWQTGGGPSELYGGSGDDRLSGWFATEPGLVLDGGEGTDSVAVAGPSRPGAGGRPASATLTMADGLIVAAGVTWGTFAGEDVGLYTAMEWEYLGTDDPEVVHTNGTWLHATTYGGDDEIWGSDGPDRIDAGDGTDKIRAGRGRDTCRSGENVRGCERID
ncbi:calcium-binding protein [Nocardioides sp. HB32]